MAKDLVFESRDPFLAALKFTIAENALDSMMGIKDDDTHRITEKLDKFIINLNNVDGLKERLNKTQKLIYLSDNCGEIVFDKLFLEVIREIYHLDVTLVTRTLPVLNDATLQDAYLVGLDKVAHLMENGIPEPFPGTIIEKVSVELRALVEESDLLISKGGGNHDSLTEEERLKGKISFLLHAKCYPDCMVHKVPLDSLIVYNF